MSTLATKTVAVIGGGVSGLAAAKAFSERGHRVLGFERAHDIGGVWESSRSYPDVQTQSPKDLYRFSDLPMPADYPEWPKGPQVQAYLSAYARKHDLLRFFQLDTRVVSMARRSNGEPGWTLVLETNGRLWTQNVDFVAVCTGQFSDKYMVSHPGVDVFRSHGGAIMHSSEYTDPDVIRGKRVVVLGASKSATDIAVNCAKEGATEVTLVYRENVWRVPYFIGGINFKRLLYMRAQEVQFNGWGRSLFQKFLYTLARPLVWANFKALEKLLTYQLRLRRWNMVPDTPIEADVSCSIPIVTPGLFESFANNAIKPIKGTFTEYDQHGVRLTTGDAIGCDVVILATGWKVGVSILPAAFQEKLVEPDGQYRLYRLAVNPDLPEMGFVGFNSSFCSVLSSEMIANWLVRYADGMLARQPTTEEMRENIDMMLRWRREERPAAMVYGGQCAAPFHFRHFDELLADIGAQETKQLNPLKEWFSYPEAEAFGHYLASAPQYSTARTPKE